MEEGVRAIVPFLEERVFPSTSRWVEQALLEEERRLFAEYRYVVFYHFDRAWQAEEACNKALRSYEYEVTDPFWFSVTVRNLDAHKIIEYGDTAVREVASVIDAAMLLTNHVLDLKVPQDKLRWRGKEGSLRDAIREKLPESPEREALIGAIDSVTKSAGYKTFLTPYRNWVTHRGAPQVIVPDALFYGQHFLPPDEALPEQLHQQSLLPNEDRIRIHEAQDPRHKTMLLESSLDNVIGTQVRVLCWPFPSIFGAWWDDAKELERTNPHPNEAGPRTRFAGADLATYTAREYTSWITGLVFFFVKNVLRRAWDISLCALLDR